MPERLTEPERPSRRLAVVRLAALLVARTLYRVRAEGLENVPAEGGALLVSNHVTWVDPLLLACTLRRPIRFVTGRETYDRRLLRPLLRLTRAIPISPADPPRRVIESLREARASVEGGSLVCIFAEGAMTRNGNLRGFRPGLERIAGRGGRPIVPVHIGGAWGSVFSYRGGSIARRLPRRIPYPVTVVFGAPLPPDSTTAEVRRAVQELSSRHFDMQKSPGRVLPDLFVKRARRSWFRQALSDTTGARLSFGRALVAALALGRQIGRIAGGQGNVGIALPASAGAALANLAVCLTGRVPVNLNFTASAEAVASAVRQAGLGTVISSRRFVEKYGKFAPPPGTVYLEDIAAGIRAPARLLALARALAVPARRLTDFRRPGPDDAAAIIFSSGTTGEPKGVVLTHHNIISNVEAMVTVYPFTSRDGMCAVLPLFHSFGFTCTLWCPMMVGFRACFHGNPLDGETVARMVREERLTVLLGTPAFLLAYARRAERGDFATLRCVIAGAEKLRPAVADGFERQFGIRPLEGYGTTELSPVVALNVPDVRAGGVDQTGVKEGSVGHPLPGIAVRVVDADSGAVVPDGEKGLLMVKGPNVMAGYLGRPEATAGAIRDGWYDTGDIARVDGDGFLYILDRVSRYSKIGGEMVPHLAVEEALARRLGLMEPAVAVSAGEDERRGEQLVLFFRGDVGPAERINAMLGESGLPNLWRPRKDNLVEVDSLPVLGSGKLDLHRLKQMAQEHVRGRPGLLRRAAERIAGAARWTGSDRDAGGAG